MKYPRIEGGRKLGSFIEPMKAQLSDRPAFDSPDWLFEIKWDGYRAIAETGKSPCRLYSRNGLSFDKAYTKVFDALSKIDQPMVLDEIVVFDPSGKPSFQNLQNYRNQDKHLIQYMVFDLLEVDGNSLTSLSLMDRKTALSDLLPDSKIIRYCDHVEEEGIAFFQQMRKLDLEGMIAKKKNSKYYPGKRSADWLKIKNVKTQDAVIVGFTEPKGSRSHFGSLLLAVNDSKGRLVSIGAVGTGFDEQSLAAIHKKLKLIIRDSSPLDIPIKETPDITWVDPVLVCALNYAEITGEGSVRHPVFLGLRTDIDPDDVQLEKQ
ncbi:MAG TPA: non-homologous end-joining DNA ligase [Cyclobacteriaceae bacterium]|nr:non-homologous end-joining DNA ligase [Cyclobacteriaceae bacterium]